MPKRIGNPEALQLCIRLDKPSRKMLNEMVTGSVSNYLRQLIVMEYARMEVRKELAAVSSDTDAD
jgi:hypothetical protein